MPIHHQETHTYIHARFCQTNRGTTPHFTLLNWILAEQPWEHLVQHIAKGGERLTIHSHLVVKARKRRPACP